MSEPMIRPIREEDVSQIHEIEKACFAMPWSEESILHDVKENVVARWLVLDDGEGNVLAYAGMWFVLDEAHVCNVAVRPDCRGKGYGKPCRRAAGNVNQIFGCGRVKSILNIVGDFFSDERGALRRCIGVQAFGRGVFQKRKHFVGNRGGGRRAGIAD